MSELGYIEGIEKIITRIKETNKNKKFIEKLQPLVDAYQFSEIISISKKSLDS